MRFLKYSLAFFAVLFLFVPHVSFAYDCECSCKPPAPDEEEPDDPGDVLDFSDDIIISEIFPNPADNEADEEFIELYNTGTDPVNLYKWQLSDNSKSVYTFDNDDFSSLTIEPEEYFVVYRNVSSIALNNTGGDQVILHHPDGELTDGISYEKAPEAESLSFDIEGQSWLWTSEVTPGDANIFIGGDDTTDPDDDSGGNDDTNDEGDSGDTTDGGTGDDSGSNDAPSEADIRITELLPDPEGSDTTGEWIELYNASDFDADLFHWSVADPQTKYTFKEGAMIFAGGYYVLWRGESGISLNNTGDSVTLFNPASLEMMKVTYTASTSGSSWANFEGDVWQWTSKVTPGEQNVLASQSVEATQGDSVNMTTSSLQSTDVSSKQNAAAYQEVGILQARTLPKGTKVRVTGQVSVVPGVFHDSYMYIMDDDAGIQVYFSKKEWPTLEEGYTVQVTGKFSQAHEEKKINVTDVNDIVIVDSNASKLNFLDIASFSEEYEGALVRVQGRVTKKSATRLTLNDFFIISKKKDTGIDFSSVTADMDISMVGILTQQKDEYQLWPRKQDDVVLMSQAVQDTAARKDTVISSSKDNIVSSVIPSQPFSLPQSLSHVLSRARLISLGIASGIMCFGVAVFFLEKKYKFLKKIIPYKKEGRNV